MKKNRKSLCLKNIEVEKTDFEFGGIPPPNPKFQTPQLGEPVETLGRPLAVEKVWGSS